MTITSYEPDARDVINDITHNSVHAQPACPGQLIMTGVCKWAQTGCYELLYIANISHSML